jgi:cytochrome c-type biogenesis protein CcmH/NrfG
MNSRHLLISVACWLQVGAAALAQTNVPESALRAESDGQWEEAIEVYRHVLEREPGRVDLWLRVADIAARLERRTDVRAALARAIEASPGDPDLYVRLSQASAADNDSASALKAIDSALAMKPYHPEYLRAGAMLATWHGDYDIAVHRYRALQRLLPSDAGIVLNLARVSAWAGNTAGAVTAYREYLQANPDASDEWLELASTESWRGRNRTALDVLETYRRRFGTSRAYSIVLATVLTGAGRPSRAIDVLEPLRQQEPGSYDVNVARAIALAMRRNVGDARDALQSVRRSSPDSRDTRNTERLVRASLGSSVEPTFTFYGDSDDLHVARVSPFGTLMLRSGTRLAAGYSRSWLRARPQSGLASAAGGTIRHEHTWAGLDQTFGSLTVSGRLGSALADEQKRAPYAVGVQWRASDMFMVGAERSHEFVVISPRTVELGLMQRRYRAQMAWSPTLDTFVTAEGTYQELSDGNHRWEVRISPRQAIVRTGWLNVDLGLSAYHLQASQDVSNGYYDPRGYDAYEVTAFPYFKVSENVGVGLSLAAGGQRERHTPLRFGGSAGAEVTLGIYQAWSLRLGATATHNLRQDSGAFRGYAGSAAVVRRF